jgi:hypothetical protein
MILILERVIWGESYTSSEGEKRGTGKPGYSLEAPLVPF